jgi:hypothetical protein
MLPIAAIFALFFLPQAAADITAPPANTHAEITVTGKGTQVYKCAVQNNTYAWVFQEPNADLFDTVNNLPVGTHTAGPTWTWNDKSAITGKILQTSPSSDPAAIPWLLLEVHSIGGPGALAGIKYVRRSDTQAGVAPPQGCDAQHLDNLLKVPYQATYTFYTAQ